MTSTFEHHQKLGDVRKQTPDKRLASATLLGAQDRLEHAQAIFPTSKPKYIVENAYEAIRESIDSVLYAKGYKSYSHEASIAYLSALGFSQQEIASVDRLRKHRNDIKYYGTDATKTQAKNAIDIAKHTIIKIIKKAPL